MGKRPQLLLSAVIYQAQMRHLCRKSAPITKFIKKAGNSTRQKLQMPNKMRVLETAKAPTPDSAGSTPPEERKRQFTYQANGEQQ